MVVRTKKEKEMKKIRVLIINSVEKTVTESSVSSLEDMQKIVGGLIERVVTFPNGDEVFCNEEAALDDSIKTGFSFDEYLFIGNGFIIGDADRNGNSTDAKSTVDEIKNDPEFEFISIGDIRDET